MHQLSGNLTAVYTSRSWPVTQVSQLVPTIPSVFYSVLWTDWYGLVIEHPAVFEPDIVGIQN